MARPSQFLQPGQRTAPGDLAIILLSRDQYQPITIEQSTAAVDGYAEGATLNTRFGSFPHSTLLNIPWGSQVRASEVDTGSRGRKRRRETTGEDTTSTPATPGGPESDDQPLNPSSGGPLKKAVTSSSGFVHILRPTPELWTMSLPHRTQVVYTPDYSYILSRIRARPGTRLIEAGSGSGSFTHASVRAVYNGLPTTADDIRGKVYSFEFNESRFKKMQEEIKGHYLEEMIEINHRDIYDQGFLVNGQSPKATAVFLDVPAPWKAVRQLSRSRPQADEQESSDNNNGEWISPLDPTKSAHICTFSPCIEQVTRTVTELRKLGWINVDMVEIAHRRLNVVRDRVGVNLPKEKGFNSSPADVMEAVTKLKEVSKRTQEFNELQAGGKTDSDEKMDLDSSADLDNSNNKPRQVNESADEKPWMNGRIVHRPEAEIKTHTSYLVFATLPREWTEEEEAAAYAKWPCGKEGKTIGNLDKAARKQEKRELLKPKKQKREEAKANIA